MRFLPFLILTFCFAVFGAVDDPRYPWIEKVQRLQPGSVVPLKELSTLGWKASAPETSCLVDDGTIIWRITVDHKNDSAHPVGWPSLQVRPDRHLDFSKANALAFDFRATCDIARPQVLRFVLKHGSDMIRAPITVERVGAWQEVVVDLGGKAWLNDIDLVHFYICESDYHHGDKLCFEARNFRIGHAELCPVPLKRGQAGASLWIGTRADANSQLVMAKEGDRHLPYVLHVDNNLSAALSASAEITFRFSNVFTGQKTQRRVPLGRTVSSGVRSRLSGVISLDGLAGSYYHVLADIEDGGKSVLDIRKGSDDLYIARPDESMVYSVLSFRAGLAYWVRDLRHGGFMHMVDVALPHTYDPLDPSPVSYKAFLRHFARNTCKVCEGYEAGMAGLALAAEAFHMSGDVARTRFMERMLWDSCQAMLTMQDECGGVVTQVNELMEEGLGFGWGGEKRDYRYSCDQTAEWMHGLTYATFYYLKRGGEAEKVRQLNSACRKAAGFLLKHARDVTGVLRNFIVTFKADGSVSRRSFVEDGRACDVYQPRIVSGLSFTALALMEAGERVPETWWSAFAMTTRWMASKMDGDGWFDNTCPDTREKPCCHTFLGNIYAGEGLFSAGLAAARASRIRESSQAYQAARRAYRYVTDSCQYVGVRYRPPLEFWVGPYLYWLFDAWEDYVGIEPVFRDWRKRMDHGWRVERQWNDFLRMPGPKVERAAHNGLLEVSILGYLGLRQMEDRGIQWKLLPVGKR